jgi:peroxiredoxin
MIRRNKTQKMSLWAMAIVVCLFSYAVLVFAKVTIGAKVPEFTLKDTAGNEMSSKNLKGKVVVLIFEIQGTAEKVNKWDSDIKDKYKGKKEMVVASVANLKDLPPFIPEDMVKMKLKEEHKTDIFMDMGGKVADGIGVDGTKPSIVLIDRKLSVQGYYEDLTPEVYKAIDKSLKK